MSRVILLVPLVLVVVVIALVWHGPFLPSTPPPPDAAASVPLTATAATATRAPTSQAPTSTVRPPSTATSTSEPTSTATSTPEPTSAPTATSTPPPPPPPRLIFDGLVITTFPEPGSPGRVESCVDVKVVDKKGNGIRGAVFSVNSGREPRQETTDANGYNAICGLYASPWSVSLFYVPIGALARQPVVTIYVDGNPGQRAAVHFVQR